MEKKKQLLAVTYTAVPQIVDNYNQLHNVQVLIYPGFQTRFIMNYRVNNFVSTSKKINILIMGLESTAIQGSKGLITCIIKSHSITKFQSSVQEVIFNETTIIIKKKKNYVGELWYMTEL